MYWLMSGLNLWPGNFFDGVWSFLLRQEQTEHRKTAVHSAQRSDQRGWDGRIHMTYWNQDRLNTESIIIHLCSTPVELWSQQKSSCSSSRVLEWQRERERGPFTCWKSITEKSFHLILSDLWSVLLCMILKWCCDLISSSAGGAE